MAGSSVNISKNAVITYTCKFKQGTKSWSTQIGKAGTHDCISLDPRNRGLVQLIAEQCEVSLCAEDLKRTPTLAHVRGMLELKDARNIAQAKSLVMDTPQARSLFDRSDESQPKKPRRSREEMEDMRSAAKLFEVLLPGDKTVWLQRPICESDGIIAWLDVNNVETILQFIIEQGIVKDDFFTRREYGASGVPGCWKFKTKNKDYMYARANGQWQRHADNGVAPIADDQNGDADGVTIEALPVVEDYD